MGHNTRAMPYSAVKHYVLQNDCAGRRKELRTYLPSRTNTNTLTDRHPRCASSKLLPLYSGRTIVVTSLCR